MKIKPVFDNILLEPFEFKSDKTGILLPNTIKDKPSFGTVIACPENSEDTEIIFKVNDIVIFNKFAGTEFRIDGKDYILIKQNEILAIIN